MFPVPARGRGYHLVELEVVQQRHLGRKSKPAVLKGAGLGNARGRLKKLVAGGARLAVV